MYTYSGAPAALDASLTAVQVHHLMKSPTLLARRFRDILNERFIADYLLSGRYVVQGGAIAYPSADQAIYTKDASEVVAPGGQYPLTQMDGGQLAIAQTAKRGIATHVFDEEISRLLMNPVNDAVAFLGNTVVRDVDSVALGVIASKVTATYASGAWSTAAGLITGVEMAKAQLVALKMGVEPTDIVLSPTQYAASMIQLTLANLLPRETVNQNPVLTGNWPQALGLTWTTSPNAPFSDPLMVDRNLLGGMADENIASPEFVAVAGNVEVASDRIKGRDGYEVRARRVTVPVVTKPWAAVRITGHGLA